MHQYFNTDFGYVSVIPSIGKVSFSVPGEEWGKFKDSQLYRDLTQFLEVNNCFDLLSVVPWYADSEIYAQEVSFRLSAEAWTEFENSQLFRDLVAYERKLRSQEIRDTHTELPAQECRSGSPESPEILLTRAHRESLLVRARNKLRYILSLL